MDWRAEMMPATEQVRELEIDNSEAALGSEFEHLLGSLAVFHVGGDGPRLALAILAVN